MKKIVVWIILLITLICSYSVCYAAPLGRNKSSVLSVYINNANTTYDDKLDEIVNDELQRRLDGLYFEVDSDEYISLLKNKKLSKMDNREISSLVKSSGAEYFVYVELRPFEKHSDYNLVYHNKSMTSDVFLLILNLQDEHEILRKSFLLKEKDSTSDWFIGNKSVALKSLKSIMFRVGEHISSYLPL